MSFPPPISVSHHTSVTNIEGGDATHESAGVSSSSASENRASVNPAEAHAIHDGVNLGAKRASVKEQSGLSQSIELVKPTLSQAASSLGALGKAIGDLKGPFSSQEHAKTSLQSGVALLTRSSIDAQESFVSLSHIDSSLSKESASKSLFGTPLHSEPSVRSLSQSAHGYTPISSSHTESHEHVEGDHTAHAHEEEESPILEFAENAEEALGIVATGLRAGEALEQLHEAAEAREAASTEATSSEGAEKGPEISAAHIAAAAISGLEMIASGGILIHEGMNLHNLRQEREAVKKELTAKLEAQTPSHPSDSTNITNIKEKISSGISSGLSSLSGMFQKSKPQASEKTQESPPMVDPEISRLQQRLDTLDKSIKEASTKVAISTISTGTGAAHFGLEIAGLAAKEGLSVAATIAGSGLVVGMGVIGLAVSTKSIIDNSQTLVSAQKELKETTDPAAKEKLEEKITGAKVGIARGALSAAASCLGISASGMGIAAMIGVAGLTTAVAATGFGAAAIAGIALLIGVSYLIYRNREAIADFFSKIGEGLSNLAQNFSQIGQVQSDQMNSGLSRKLEAIESTVKEIHGQQLISHSARLGPSDTTSQAERERARMQEKELEALRSMFANSRVASAAG